MPRYLVLAFITYIAIYTCSCEIYTSIEHMHRAAKASKEMSRVIKQNVETQRAKLDQLERLAEEMDTYSDRALTKPTHRLSNPVNAFLFTKKVVLDWSKRLDALWNDTITDNLIVEELQLLKEMLPGGEDLEGVVTGLMRLQDTYRLDPSRLVQGRLLTARSPRLTVDDCFELARQCYDSKDYPHAAVWFRQTWIKLNKDNAPANKSASRRDVLRYYAHSEYMNGNTSIALPLLDKLLALQPDKQQDEFGTNLKEDIVNNVRPFLNATYGPPREEEVEEDEYFDEMFRDYEALCRGEQIVASHTPRKQHELVCRYVSGEPHVTLSRFKEEELYKEPWVVLYHDVISDEHIRDLKDAMIPLLSRALVEADENITEGMAVPYRISKSAWLHDVESEMVAMLSRRVSAVTGLNTETSELLQVNNYGTGGHYLIHHDHATDEDNMPADFTHDIGNRIATFMFYMSDVVGGATVFPALGLSVPPKKGSAVFWYNLERSGAGIWETVHAGCPVLLGTKWVANKWLHERGQEFTRPCGLSVIESLIE